MRNVLIVRTCYDAGRGRPACSVGWRGGVGGKNCPQAILCTSAVLGWNFGAATRGQ